MARKLVIAKIDPSKFQAVMSAIEPTLRNGIVYSDHLVYESGIWHLIGRNNINHFCDRIEGIIRECEQVMNDDIAQKEYENDRAILKSFRKLKAE